MQINPSATVRFTGSRSKPANELPISAPRPRASLTIASIVATDFVALFLAIGMTVFIRLMLSGNNNYTDYLRLWPMIGIFLFAFALARLYPGIPMNPVNELRNVSMAVIAVFLIFAVFIFLSRSDTTWSRGVFLVACPISAVTVVLFRSGLRHYLSRKSWWGIPALVLGSGQSGQTVVETLSKSPWIGLKIVSVLDKIDENLRSSIGHSDSVNTLIRNERVNYAILAMPAESRREFFQNFEWHAERFRHVIVLPDLFGLSSLGVTAEDIGGILGLEIKQALLQRWPQFLKRVLDLAVTIIGGSLVLPLCLLICLAIKLTSSGPVVYGQRRIGKENRHFTAWKFRTMVGDADKVLNHHLENSIHLKEEWQNNHKLRNDPRVTAVGRILRHTSLDELPQLWNVLVGEMSLVGPRPIVDAEVLKYGSRFRLYCKVRPGITGLWQVSGRNDTGYDKRVHLDEYYVRNWSVWLDIYLLGRTFKCILRGAGAY